MLSKTRDSALPLINKVINKRLILVDYTLDSGHLHGLTHAIFKTLNPVIEEILFDNCGIDDGELAILLTGLMELDLFEIFAYKNNHFMSGGLKAMKQILNRTDPYNLRELRLVNCSTTSGVTAELIEHLAVGKVHLRSLSLVKMQVNKLSLARLAVFVEKSEHLEDLDVSWNDLLPLDFVPLLNVLSNNKTLVTLNLSCNMLIEKHD